MVSKKNNLGWNHDCKGSIHRYKMNLYQGGIIFASSFHDKFYIGSMGMNTKVQGRLPPLQCTTFHSLLIFEEIVVLRIYPVKHQKSMTRITFEFTRIRESIGSTHRDIFTKLYNTITGATGTRSKVKGWQFGVDDTIRQRHFVSGESPQ